MNKNKEQKKSISGVISINLMMTGYVSVDGFDDDIQIGSRFLNTALNNDEVEVILFPQVKGERLTGEVSNILKRARVEFVGTIEKIKGKSFSFVSPDDKRMYADIFLSSKESKKVKNNDKVLVRISKWDSSKKNPEGKILQVVGKKGVNDVEMQSIVLEKGFQIGFPVRVENEAKILGKKARPIPQEEILKRKDLRLVTTLTIDPEDAKDFDDAISFRKISDDLFEVGIHIADVSHYVREGSYLDKEAISRGVSIYLVDRTIPMLPEILSNDICSLRPKEDRLTFSAIMEITSSGEIKKKWFGRTVINSNKRFIYEEAQGVLDDGEGEYYYELNWLNKIARIFKEKRMRDGALDFDRDEVKFKLDAKGKPIDVIKKERLDAHKLVEEFMILANKEVATYLSGEIKKHKKGASIYRIHDVPKKGASGELLSFLKGVGYKVLEEKGGLSSKEMNSLFQKVEGKPEEALVKNIAMRTMSKAVYSTTNIGHYGLALVNYTHFTSPIRRYADLLIHRILQKHLNGKYLGDEEAARYHKLAVSLSKREVEAVEAERDSISYKQVQYMMDRVGEVYDGVISGITKWGIYVEELRTQADGMVSMRNMKDDFYVFDAKTYSIIGKKTKKKYSVGDKVKIKVIGTDLDNKTIDYMFV